MKSQVSKTKSTTDASGEKYDVGLLGAHHSGLSVVEFKLPRTNERAADEQPTSNAAIHARYHSVLAMEAAKKMRRSRQKLKTGQQVCHHLKMMLASDPSDNKPASREQTGNTEPQFRLGF